MSTPANFNGQRPVIDANDAVMLLIDHQSGLFQTVADMPMTELRAHATALARIATLSKHAGDHHRLGAAGPQRPADPGDPRKCAARAIRRPQRGDQRLGQPGLRGGGQGHRPQATLIIAGTITSVCMAFPSISAVADGYKVFAVIDASGTYSKMAQEITLARVVQAGVVPMDTAGVASELQGSWNRADAQQWAEVYTKIFPAYQLLIESYLKAQDVVKNNERLDSQR